MFRSLRSFLGIGGKKKPIPKTACVFRSTRIKFDTLEDRNAPAVGTASNVIYTFNANGGPLQFEISNATGTEGGTGTPTTNGWDLIKVEPSSSFPTIQPKIDFQATAAARYTINVATVLNADGGTPGPMSNFNPGQNYSWRFLRGDVANLAVTGTFDPAAFRITTQDFANPFTGTFSVDFRDTATPVGNDSLFLVYTAPGGAAPVASNGTLAATEDTPANGTLVSTGSNLTFIVVTAPTAAQGTVALNAQTGAYTFTPAANFNGNASFTFKTNNGLADSNTATVNITVAAVNDAPVANNGTLTATEDTTATGTLTATDVDSTTLSYSIVSQANANGTVTITNAATGAYSYQPASNFNGTASFTFKANDGTLDSTPATITINVTPVNDAPVAAPGTLSTTQNTPKTGTLQAVDVEGSPLTYSIVSQAAANGTVTITNTATGAYSYSPNATFSGTATFTFKANDGALDSNIATVTIAVSSNNAPVAQNGTLTTAEDTPATGTLLATDTDSPTLTYSIVNQSTAHGTVTITNATSGAYSYSPEANYNGPASFVFRANDGSADSNTATVNITVTAVNDAPVAQAGTLTTPEDGAASGTLVATDVDNTTLTYSIVSQANVHGTVTISNATTGAYSYTPAADYNGPATFTFKANDGLLDSNTATVTITVTPVNDPPVANNGTLTTAEDTSATGTLSATDVDSATLTYSVVSQANAHGTVTITNAATGAYSFVPQANFNGAASFTFKANDGTADSNVATVTINVTPVNDAPVASNGTLSTAPGVAATGTLVATDVDANTLTYSIVAQPAAGQGTVAITNAATGAYSYTPPAGFNGTTTFTFKANDATIDSNTATVTITVAPVGAAATTTTLTSSANPATYGGPVTFTAVVAATSGTPTGTVNFFDGATQIGTGTLSGGSTTFQISSLSAATHPITATFVGNASFVTSTSAALSEVVNKKTLTVTGITASGKVYDGKTTATINVGSAALSGVVGTDNVTLSTTGAVGTFDSKNVGQRTVTISGLTIGGTAAGNYQITPAPTATATITPKTVTITGLTAQNKVYDGTTAATLQVVGKTGIQGVVAGDRVNYNVAGATATFADPNVGNAKPVTITGVVLSSPPTLNNDAGNYVVATINTTANITPKPLTITANSRTKTLGQAITFAGTEFTSSGLVGTQTIGSATITSTGAAAGAAAGSYSIVISNATGGTFNLSNYNVTYVNGTLTVA